MKNGFIEIYDNALPDDICDYLVAVFERENMMSVSEVREFESLGDMMRRKEEEKVKEVKTINDDDYINVREKLITSDTEQDMSNPTFGTKYVSALDLLLDEKNYLYDSIIGDLDWVLKDHVFKYNTKYNVWASKLNLDLIKDEEEKESIRRDVDNPEIISRN